MLIFETTSVDKNNGTNDKFYRKVAILMYTEMFNHTEGLGTRLPSP